MSSKDVKQSQTLALGLTLCQIHLKKGCRSDEVHFIEAVDLSQGMRSLPKFLAPDLYSGRNE